MIDPGTPYASFRDAWLAAEPEWHVARPLFAEARAPRDEALLVLEHLLRDAALHIAEARVAETKLSWWVDELQRAGQGTPRHPVTQALHAAGVGGEMATLAHAAVAAARLVTLESSATLDGWLAAIGGVALPFARVRAGGALDAAAGTSIAAATAVLAARRWSALARADRALLPLDVLAEAGVSRSAASSSPVVVAALMRALQPRLDPPSGARHHAADAIGTSPSRIARLDAARVAIARDIARRAARRPQALLDGALWRPRVVTVLRWWRLARRGHAPSGA